MRQPCALSIHHLPFTILHGIRETRPAYRGCDTARHARGGAAPRGRPQGAPRRGHLPVQPRPRLHRAHSGQPAARAEAEVLRARGAAVGHACCRPSTSACAARKQCAPCGRRDSKPASWLQPGATGFAARRGADEAWTAAAMRRACARYEEIFGAPALTHGAPGWQMNRFAYRHTQRLGFRIAPIPAALARSFRSSEAKSSPARSCRPRCPRWTNCSPEASHPDEAVRRLLEREPRSGADRPRLHAARRSRGHDIRAGAARPARRLARVWATRSSRCAITRPDSISPRLPRRVIVEHPVPGARGTVAVGRQGISRFLMNSSPLAPGTGFVHHCFQTVADEDRPTEC